MKKLKTSGSLFSVLANNKGAKNTKATSIFKSVPNIKVLKMGGLPLDCL
ncbi:MAG: hypothetical protein GW839_13610 [Flavobacteriales bacterium]|nr:hypothetical protein [Flavobacteriales bacterium]NCP61319.1 hypothetical protein [Flavobacteriales bacterium]